MGRASWITAITHRSRWQYPCWVAGLDTQHIDQIESALALCAERAGCLWSVRCNSAFNGRRKVPLKEGLRQAHEIPFPARRKLGIAGRNDGAQVRPCGPQPIEKLQARHARHAVIG